jgi:hypothetical protein
MSFLGKTGSIITWPARQLATAVKQGFSPDTHRSAKSVLRLPFDARKHRGPGHDPDELKKLDQESLLRTWGIDPESVPRIKRTIKIEIILWFGLLCLSLSNVIYWFFNPGYSFIATLVGFALAIVSFLQILLRHHWLLILQNGKYKTFRDYLSGRD